MKKYLIAVAALAVLAACTGKSNQNVPVEVEEETMAVVEAVPDAPVLPVVTQKLSKPVNMRDSLKVDKKKGAVMQKKYKGTVPSQAGSDVTYDLTLYYQQGDEVGVYQIDATSMAENGQNQTLTSTGKSKMIKGTPADVNAVVYELIPSDGSVTVYMLAEGDNLTILNQEMQKAASDLNYTLKLVQ